MKREIRLVFPPLDSDREDTWGRGRGKREGERGGEVGGEVNRGSCSHGYRVVYIAGVWSHLFSAFISSAKVVSNPGLA